MARISAEIQPDGILSRTERNPCAHQELPSDDARLDRAVPPCSQTRESIWARSRQSTLAGCRLVGLALEPPNAPGHSDEAKADPDKPTRPGPSNYRSDGVRKLRSPTCVATDGAPPPLGGRRSQCLRLTARRLR